MTDSADAHETNEALERARERIAPLLHALGIKLVINVDDKWALQGDDLESVQTAIATHVAFAREVLRQLEDDDSNDVEGIDPENAASVSDRVGELWANIGVERRARLTADARGFANDLDGDVQQQQLAAEIGSESRLDALFGPQIEFRGIGMRQWADASSEILAGDQPVLLLVDRDFSSEEGGTISTGEQLLADAVRAGNTHVHAALLSHTAVDEAGEQDLRREIEQGQDLPLGSVLVVGKFRLRDGGMMPAAIRDLLVLAAGEQVRALALKAIETAAERAMTALKELQPYTLVGAVAAAQLEGAFELDQPVRLVERAQREAMLEVVRDPAVAEHLAALRSSELVRTYLSAAEGGAQLLKVLHEACFESAATINRLGLPVEIGDIFQLRSVYPVSAKQTAPAPKNFILLAQVCDISMRRGGRRQPDVPTFVLHEFRMIEQTSQGEPRGAHARLHSIGPFEPTSPTAWGVNFGTRIVVPAVAVDAVTLNVEGESVITVDGTDDRPMSGSWVARAGHLRTEAKKMVDSQASALEDLSKVLNSDALLRRLGASFAGATMTPKTGVTAEIDVEAKQVRYGLRRVGRLSPKIAPGIAALAASYDGRPGFDPVPAISAIPGVA